MDQPQMQPSLPPLVSSGPTPVWPGADPVHSVSTHLHELRVVSILSYLIVHLKA
jgi:hypothetical protein